MVRKEAANVESIAGLLRKLGMRPVGGNYATMKRIMSRLDVDTSHWTGQAWGKGKRLKDWTDYSRIQKLKPHLIRERGHQCQSCQNTEWLGHPITLEVHHIDGDRTNNGYENLQLICCNCHSTTDNWRGKAKRK